VGVLRRLLRHPSAALGAAVLVLSVGAAVAAPLLAPADPNHGILADRLAPPGHVGTTGMTYLLGADQIGRDILSRILHGARVSLAVGALTTLLSMLAGLALGTVAGFFRGPFDGALSRFADVLMAFPYLIFAIGAMAVMGPGFGNLVMALAFKGWVEFYRLARGETLVQTTREYVEGARAVGASAARIIRRHIVPNIVHTSLVLATLRMGYFIVLEASLSFLGLGLPPRIPAWGSMVADGREVMLTAWWVSTLPGLAIVVVVLAVNLFGEGVRDILDPRLKVD
jgi:peptide/nickel transport system permease protein